MAIKPTNGHSRRHKSAVDLLLLNGGFATTKRLMYSFTVQGVDPICDKRSESVLQL